MSKHTPGPWSLNKRFKSPVVALDLKDGGALLPIVDAVHGFDNAQAKANARLIAAAPELLEALQELRANIGAASLSQNEKGKQVRALADAAIAKATGEQP